MMGIDRTSLARKFIKVALKAKKLLRIYPANNIIYRTAIDETYSAASEYLSSCGDLVLLIKPDTILLDSDQVYQSSGKLDNFAFYFFKEGIRELTLKRGLPKNELEEFLKLTGTDFDRDDARGDFISSVWEKSFQSIKLTIDEMSFIESDAIPGTAGYGMGEGNAGAVIDGAEQLLTGGASEAVTQQLSGVRSQGDPSGENTEYEIYTDNSLEDSLLLSAYKDAVARENAVPLTINELTTHERGFILAEIRQEHAENAGRLAEILMEMLLVCCDNAEACMTTKAIQDLIIYCLRGNDIGSVLVAIKGLKLLPSEGRMNRRCTISLTEHCDNVIAFCGSKPVIDQLGRILDATKEISEADLTEYARLIGRVSVALLISLLEHLQSISARRMVNNVLIHVGKQDMDALVARLKDPTWYVVRNIVYVLRNIGDDSVLNSLLWLSGHENPRVRLEVVNALNVFRSARSVRALTGFLDDSDSTVRLSAIGVIAAAAKESPATATIVRDAIFARIRHSGFENRDFREKKSFYEAMAPLNDSEVEEFMISTLRKKSIFSSRKGSETRACALYYLGLAGSREAIPIIEKLRNSSDRLIRDHAVLALQRKQHE